MYTFGNWKTDFLKIKRTKLDSDLSNNKIKKRVWEINAISTNQYLMYFIRLHVSSKKYNVPSHSKFSSFHKNNAKKLVIKERISLNSNSE